MKERPKCAIEGCTNTVQVKGKTSDGSPRLRSTCRSHHADGSPKYRHRGRKTTSMHRKIFNKKVV